jgi:SAM-dependent methyltransferase
LEELLRCPRCGSTVQIGRVVSCANGHEYPVRQGVPRLVESAWRDAAASQLQNATSEAFGDQWNELGESAGVTLDDVKLHLPAGWDTSIFQGNVLDAGCGMGRYTKLVTGLDARAVGLDVSDAVDKAAQLWPDVPFVQADIAAPPFEAGAFDVVYSFGVLHHLPDPIRGWQTCFNLVKPGGLLLAWVYSQHGGMLRQGRRTLRVVAGRWPVLRKPIAAAAAGGIWAYLRANRLLKGKAKRSTKLGFYDDKTLSQLFVDCHDALAAPSEMYLTEADCRAWLASIPSANSGFERRSDGSGWIIWARA